jgi:hypothetical protein
VSDLVKVLIAVGLGALSACVVMYVLVEWVWT